MRETQDIVTASRMPSMVQICKKNTHFVTKQYFIFFTFRPLSVESPRQGAIHDVPLATYISGLSARYSFGMQTRALTNELVSPPPYGWLVRIFLSNIYMLVLFVKDYILYIIYVVVHTT